MTETLSVTPEVINQNPVFDIVQTGNRIIDTHGEPELYSLEQYDYYQLLYKQGLRSSPEVKPHILLAKFTLADRSRIEVTKPTEIDESKWLLSLHSSTPHSRHGDFDIFINKDGTIKNTSFVNGSHSLEAEEEAGGDENIPLTKALTPKQAEELADWLKEFEKSPSRQTRLKLSGTKF